LLQSFISPPLVPIDAATHFGILIPFDIRHDTAPPSIGPGAAQKFGPAQFFVAQGAAIQNVLIVDIEFLIDAPKQTVPGAGKETASHVAHDILHPTVVAVGSETDGPFQAAAGGLTAPNQGLNGAVFARFEQRVLGVVVDRNVVRVAARAAIAAVADKCVVVVVGVIGLLLLLLLLFSSILDGIKGLYLNIGYCMCGICCG